MFRKTAPIWVCILVLLLAVPVHAAADVQATGFDEIHITGQGPVGIELVRTDNDRITMEYLGVEDNARFLFSQSVQGGRLQLSITNTAPQSGLNVQFGPEQYRNVIRIHIPDIPYEKFEVDVHEMVVHMQDFNAPVSATAERGGIYLLDETFERGTWRIDVTSGPVSITAATITSNMDVRVESGPIALRFGEQPQNLYLDTTGCGPLVRRPDTWAAIYRTGNETPRISLVNTNGPTAVDVGPRP